MSIGQMICLFKLPQTSMPTINPHQRFLSFTLFLLYLYASSCLPCLLLSNVHVNSYLSPFASYFPSLPALPWIPTLCLPCGSYLAFKAALKGLSPFLNTSLGSQWKQSCALLSSEALSSVGQREMYCHSSPQRTLMSVYSSVSSASVAVPMQGRCSQWVKKYQVYGL